MSWWPESKDGNPVPGDANDGAVTAPLRSEVQRLTARIEAPWASCPFVERASLAATALLRGVAVTRHRRHGPCSRSVEVA